ncbi:MAG: hypothetical protein IID03_12065 [Candidatus Dadabacteria bacterium]|nr:hypothetical protein [Candidatus Dadabacteria bacterium]
MKVYECGLKVTTVMGGIEGIIIGICIRFNRVQYELSYFEKGTHENSMA